MKRLVVTYNGMTLFDGDVAELSWTDTQSGVRVEGKTRVGGGGLVDMLTGLSKAKTEQDVEKRRAVYLAEKEATE